MKKIKLILIGLMVGILIPNYCNAAEITYGKEDKNTTGVVKIPLLLNVHENESPFENIKIKCSSSSMDVECSFEKSNSTVVSATGESAVFASIKGDNHFIWDDEPEEIGYLVLKNKEYSSKETLFSISNNGTQGALSLPAQKSITVSALKKEVVESDEPRLTKLEVKSGGKVLSMYPEFNEDVESYTVYGIADTINTVNIATTCKEGYCQPVINGSRTSKTIKLEQGENIVKVVVYPESEKKDIEKIYTLKILRGETGYNSAKLKSLTFGEYTLTPAFKSNVYEYSLTVPNTVDSLVNELEYALEDEKAKVTTSGVDSFVVGDNKLTITIDNVNGDETVTYTVNVKRMSDEEIEIIKYINDEVTFKDSEGIQTTLPVSEFKVQYPKEWKMIENKEIKFDEEGNVIVEKEEEKEETKEEKKKSKAWLIVLLVVIGLAIIGVSGFFIFKKKKPSDKIQENKEELEQTDESNENKEKELDENSNEVIEEENKIKEAEEEIDEEKTMDIDEALNDLMSTKKYEFKDED